MYKQNFTVRVGLLQKQQKAVELIIPVAALIVQICYLFKKLFQKPIPGICNIILEN